MSKVDQFIKLIRSQTNEQLIELAKMANVDTSNEADIVVDAVTSELMMRLPEPQFVALCAELEG